MKPNESTKSIEKLKDKNESTFVDCVQNFSNKSVSIQNTKRKSNRKSWDVIIEKLKQKQEQQEPKIEEKKKSSEDPSFVSMKATCVKYVKQNGIIYSCPYCTAKCTYISTAIRHLVKSHQLVRSVARSSVYNFINDTIKGDQSLIDNKEDSIDEMESTVSKSTDTTNKYQTTVGMINDENTFNSTNDGNSNSTNLKRYATRYSKRKKCFYDCNSKNCFYSKHFKLSNGEKMNEYHNDNHCHSSVSLNSNSNVTKSKQFNSNQSILVLDSVMANTQNTLEIKSNSNKTRKSATFSCDKEKLIDVGDCSLKPKRSRSLLLSKSNGNFI